MLTCNVPELYLTVQARTRKEILKILAERLAVIVGGEELRALECHGEETRDNSIKRVRKVRDRVLAFLAGEVPAFQVQLETPGRFARFALLKVRSKEPLALKLGACGSTFRGVQEKGE